MYYTMDRGYSAIVAADKVRIIPTLRACGLFWLKESCPWHQAALRHFCHRARVSQQAAEDLHYAKL